MNVDRRGHKRIERDDMSTMGTIGRSVRNVDVMMTMEHKLEVHLIATAAHQKTTRIPWERTRDKGMILIDLVHRKW